jgi:hypothetical protein
VKLVQISAIFRSRGYGVRNSFLRCMRLEYGATQSSTLLGDFFFCRGNPKLRNSLRLARGNLKRKSLRTLARNRTTIYCGIGTV